MPVQMELKRIIISEIHEQQVIAQLSVFSGGCTLDSAEAVVTTQDLALDLFDALATQQKFASLVATCGRPLRRPADR